MSEITSFENKTQELVPKTKKPPMFDVILLNDNFTSISVCNGTAALFLALKAFGIGKDDKVAVPLITFAATANAVLHTGAEPVFVDIDKDTWCLDPNQLRETIK